MMVTIQKRFSFWSNQNLGRTTTDFLGQDLNDERLCGLAEQAAKTSSEFMSGSRRLSDEFAI